MRSETNQKPPKRKTEKPLNLLASEDKDSNANLEDLKNRLYELLEENDALEMENQKLRRQQEELEKHEEHLLRLGVAFEQSANSIMITDIGGNIVYANPRFYSVSGYAPEEIVGKNPRILKYEHSIINYKDLWETITRGETWSGEFLNRSKSGKLFWEIGTITPVKNKQGKIINFIAIKEDITRRKQTEEKLLKARDFYLGLLEDFPVMIWQCNPAGQFDFFNKTFLHFAGWGSPEHTDDDFFNLIHPKDKSLFEEAFRNSLKSRSPFVVEFRLRDRYNNYRWVLNHGKPFSDVDNNYRGFISSCIDIHDRILIEQRLMESENKYRRMFEESSMGIFRLDRKFSFAFANMSFAQIFGFDNVAEFLVALNNNTVDYFPDYRNEMGFVKQIVKATESRFVVEKQLRGRNGQTIYAILYLRRISEKGPEREYYIEGFVEDISQRKKTEENLVRSEQKFRALFDKSYDAIVILNEEIIADCNLKASDLFGIPCEELFGMRFIDLISRGESGQTPNADNFGKRVALALENKPQIFDLELLHRHQRFEAEISMTRIFVNNKAMVQAIIRDVSEQRFAEKQIKQARDEAERARKAQSDFLSLMSHEIRTPLNAVVSLTDLMLLEKLNADQMENLSSVKVSARHLLALIDDILDYNKIESGNIQFENSDFNIRNLLHELQKSLQVKAREKGIRLFAEVDEGVPLVLRADTLRLRQVLLNLLSNAIKFTDMGYVKLSVKRKQDYPGDIRCFFEVEDTGIGIEKDRLEAIFEKFTQAETSTSRKYGGSGLGLSISKRLIELQGGEIYAQSTRGKGSVFSFFLIMEQGEESKILNQGKPEVEAAHSLKGMQVLLVEDDKMNQFVASKIIEKKWQAQLTIASSGEEALQLLRGQDFDLVLLDLLLPGISGYEVAQSIRSAKPGEKINPQIPIIALTADAFMETRNKAFEAGIDDFVSKPFDYLKLLMKISRYKPPSS